MLKTFDLLETNKDIHVDNEILHIRNNTVCVDMWSGFHSFNYKWNKVAYPLTNEGVISIYDVHLYYDHYFKYFIDLGMYNG